MAAPLAVLSTILMTVERARCGRGGCVGDGAGQILAGSKALRPRCYRSRRRRRPVAVRSARLADRVGAGIERVRRASVRAGRRTVGDIGSAVHDVNHEFAGNRRGGPVGRVVDHLDDRERASRGRGGGVGDGAGQILASSKRYGPGAIAVAGEGGCVAVTVRRSLTV